MLNKKDKGSRFEYLWRDMLRESGLDIYAQRTPLSGALAGMKSDILTTLPFQFELKHQETWRPLAYYQQAKLGLNLGSGKAPVVVFRSNKSPIFVMMEGQDWINLAQKALDKGYKKEIAEVVEKIKQNNPNKVIHSVPKPEPKNKKSKFRY